MSNHVKVLAGAAILAMGAGAQAVTFSTTFDDITNAEVASHVLTHVGTFSGGSSTNAAGAIAFGLDRVITLSNLVPGSPQTITLNFTLATAAASFSYDFWASTNSNVIGANTGVVVTLFGPGGTQTFTEIGLGSVGSIGNANPGGVHHDGTFLGGAAGNYSLTFGNRAGNNGFRLDDVSITATPVPEPETYVLMLSGLAMLMLMAGRRQR